MVVSTNYTSFFNPYNYAVFDLYLFLLTMIMIAIVRIKYVRFLIPILCIVCVAIHEVYVTTYMVIIGCVLLYELVKSKFSFRNILLTAVSYLSIIGSFVLLQFFTKPLPYSSSEQLIKALAPTTDINMNKGVFDFGYFYNNSLKENFDLLFNTHIGAAFLTLLLISPIYLLFFYIWKNMISFSKTKLEKFVYFVFAVSPIVILPSFFIAIDYDRWFAAINVTQFVLIFYLYITKDKHMHKTIQKLQLFYQKHSWIFISLILYFSALTFLKINTTGFIGEYLKEHFVWR
ncbi:hypothetical protein SDC9_117974 [bioreactor metagenome]|uniref:Uncharacterized protein n=1 Tax=bioreactor metagenome TaxID=1076179 RepID=A0A645C234_9ZZZZ